jgi:hypothetical protein
MAAGKSRRASSPWRRQWRTVTSSLRSAPRATFIAGQLPAPMTKGRAALTTQHGAGLGRRAKQGVGQRTAGQYAAAVRRGSRSKATTCVMRWPARRGLTTRASRQWQASQHARRGNGAHSARRRMLGSSPALWRRSRARSCRFPARQRDFDCVFVQKVELCNKNVNTKAVDETSLYNIYKGRPMFFSMV